MTMNIGTRHPTQQKHNENSGPQHQKTKWATFANKENYKPP